jgi:hypothetical protein
MDTTITYDEVAALVGVNIPTLEPRPNFERIRALRRHLERCLQRLPCPQSIQHGWKGMVMARPLYSLLTNIPFRLPTNPGAAAVYVRALVLGQPIDNAPLTRTEQASIDTLFNRRKHYFLSMQNIERACFTALDSSINDAFKVSNDPTVQGWHAGMRVIDILDQLSLIYGQPTPAALEANDHIFRSPTSAADAPKVLFRRIEECAEKALLGQNPYTDKQLITNTIRLLLTTGLYIRAFEDWDEMDDTAKTWIELRRLIQEAFQRRLNATAPTAGHHGYAPALPFQQNAFGALASNDSDEDDSTEMVATQMAALTYQSQLTATTAANSSQQMGQYMQTLAHQQDLLHQNQHQMMEQMAALSFNQSDAGRGIGRQGRGLFQYPAPFTPTGFGRGGHAAPTGYGRGGQGRGRGRGRGRGPPGFGTGRGPPFTTITTGRTPGYTATQNAGGGYYATPPPTQHVPAPHYSNIKKQFANWNACYSCGFDVPDGHTSQTCNHHLRKPGHDINFTRQNAQQFIDQGYNCSTKNRHKTVFPQM